MLTVPEGLDCRRGRSPNTPARRRALGGPFGSGRPRRRRQGIRGSEDIQVNIEIGMREPIAHADDVGPRDIRGCFAHFGAGPARRFAGDLRCMNKGEPEHFVCFEVQTASAFDEARGGS